MRPYRGEVQAWQRLQGRTVEAHGTWTRWAEVSHCFFLSTMTRFSTRSLPGTVSQLCCVHYMSATRHTVY